MNKHSFNIELIVKCDKKTYKRKRKYVGIHIHNIASGMAKEIREEIRYKEKFYEKDE